jgi:PEGA domain
MSMSRMAALQAGLLFFFSFFLAAMFANATPQNGTIRIKVLDSETRSVSLGGNDVPKNCDGVNFDAYCNNGKSALLTNTLLVEEGNQTPFRVACTIDSRFSRCTPLPKGESFDARRVKHGLTVYYVDGKGKTRSQLYTLVDADRKAGPPASAAAVTTQPVPEAVASQKSSPAPAAAPAAVAAQPVSPEKGLEKVRCNFGSTPSGADITVDGKYLGSTPSEIPLDTGTHVIVVSLPGFAEWKRELTVLPGSQLTVDAILQKQQP